MWQARLFPLLTAMVVTTALTSPSVACADSPANAPPLPEPIGRVVTVSEVERLHDAVENIASDSTILIQPGTYRLHRPLQLVRNVRNVSIRGATGNVNDVVIHGGGMEDLQAAHGFMIQQGEGITIADLSIGLVGYHPITIQSGVSGVRIYHCRLFDAGEQFIKGNSGGDGRGSENGRVEYCVIEYSDHGPADGYTNGVDIHGGKNWIIRHNLFLNIRTLPTSQYRHVPSVLMWNGAKNTICEANTFINCDRAIAFGLSEREGFADHEGGVIRNNLILAAKDEVPNLDTGIYVESQGTKVLHNTVIHNGGYPNAIEVRWARSRDVEIANNLTDGNITARDGAMMETANNVTNARSSMFTDAAGGNLHIANPPPQVSAHADCRTDWDGDERSSDLVTVGADEPAAKAK